MNREAEMIEDHTKTKSERSRSPARGGGSSSYGTSECYRCNRSATTSFSLILKSA